MTMVLDWMTPVGLGNISTVWDKRQFSVREKEWAKVYPEEVGTETAHPWACTACPGPAGLQVRKYTLHLGNPLIFNTHSPSPYSLSRPGLNWNFLALTDSLFLSELLSDAFEMMFSLVCSRYPSNLQAFSRSHLPGPWDSSRAGKRMKLARPETWERELSLRGNKATVWEELIGRVTLTITLPSCLPHLCLYILAPEIEVSMAWCSYFHLVFPSPEMTGFNRSAIDHTRVASGLCFE